MGEAEARLHRRVPTRTRPSREWRRQWLVHPGGGRCSVEDNGRDNRILGLDESILIETIITVGGNGNSIELASGARLEGCRIVVSGDGNSVTIGSSWLGGVVLTIIGGNNRIAFAEECRVVGLGAVCEDDGNNIVVLSGTEFAGPAELAALEGTSIRVGAHCLFSRGVSVRTSDSHSLVDLAGRRINPSKDVTIGNHVWLGMNVTILKGASVPDSSVVGACAVVTKAFETPHSVLAGNPARVVREDVDWRVERIACE
jgi:acetyltransferase-like isoleucine patch superfamily enzyme